MKKISIPILLILSTVLVNCGGLKTLQHSDVQELNLKGKVKTLKSQSYYAKDSAGYAVKTFKGTGYGDFSYQDVVINLNASGDILKKIELSRNGEEEERIENEYNESAKITVQQTYNDGDLASKTEYTYYENGKLKTKKEKKYAYTDAFYLTSYQYDNFKNPILITHKEINQKDTVIISNKKLTNQYNEKGIRTQTYIYWGEEEIKIKYDRKDNIILSETVKGFENQILPKHTYTYNDQNLLIKESNYYAGNEFAFANHFTYNKDGLLIEESSSTELNGKYKKKKEIRYNKLDQIIEQETFDDKGNLKETATLMYENDAKGNWIKRTVLINGKPNSIVERTITYY